MITCSYCTQQYRDGAGLSMHIRRTHADQWKGSLRTSVPEGFDYVTGAETRPSRTLEARRTALRLAKTKSTAEERAKKNEWYHQNKDRIKLARKAGKPLSEIKRVTAVGRPRGSANRTCPVCAKKFSSRPNMTLHLRKVHKQSIIEFATEEGGTPDKYRASAEARLVSPNGRRNKHAVAVKAPPARGHIDFCPRCGYNVKAHELAAGFMEQ